jgi:hypothetical protein
VSDDCNNYKLGGLAAGAATTSRGIASSGRLNATVRNCNILGFTYGVFFTGPLGAVTFRKTIDSRPAP